VRLNFEAPARIAAVAMLGLVVTLAGACELVAEPSAPSASSSTAAAPRSTPMLTAPVPTPEPTFLIYQVRPNDALEAIAKRFKTTVDSIGFWNRDRYATLDPDSAAYRPDSIKVGWLLRIHPGQTTDGDDGSATDEPSPSGSPDGSPDGSPPGSSSASPAS
jgi:hypothetical protein